MSDNHKCYTGAQPANAKHLSCLRLSDLATCRPQEGLFGLREWLDEGYYPEGWVGPPDGLGLAPFKRRNSASANAGGGGGGGTSPSKASRTGVRSRMLMQARLHDRLQ